MNVTAARFDGGIEVGFGPLGVGVMMSAVGAMSFGAELKVNVKATVPREEFLLGQTVRLHTTLTNSGAAPLKFPQIDLERFDDVRVYVAPDAGTFQRIPTGLTGGIARRPVETLEAGTSRNVVVPLLFRSGREGPLALSEPGTYRVRVEFRLLEQGVGRELLFTSEPITIRVREPAGGDADVFARIKSRRFVAFLHHGRSEAADADLLLVSQLLEEFPGSAYRGDLRLAARNGFRLVRNSLPRDLAARLKKAAEFQEALDFKDNRLDREVEPDWGVSPTVERVVRSLSERSGRTLEVATELRSAVVPGTWMTASVRTQMDLLDVAVRAYWFPKGDGYILAPPDYEPPADPKKP